MPEAAAEITTSWWYETVACVVLGHIVRGPHITQWLRLRAAPLVVVNLWNYRLQINSTIGAALAVFANKQFSVGIANTNITMTISWTLNCSIYCQSPLWVWSPGRKTLSPCCRIEMGLLGLHLKTHHTFTVFCTLCKRTFVPVVCKLYCSWNITIAFTVFSTRKLHTLKHSVLGSQFKLHIPLSVVVSEWVSE